MAPLETMRFLTWVGTDIERLSAAFTIVSSCQLEGRGTVLPKVLEEHAQRLGIKLGMLPNVDTQRCARAIYKLCVSPDMK